MDTEIEGVVNGEPVPNDVPPVELAYQFIVPAEAVAAKFTVPVPQREPGVVPVMVGIVLTVATTAVREADVHVPVVAST